MTRLEKLNYYRNYKPIQTEGNTDKHYACAYLYAADRYCR